ncbi:VanZ family protein [Paenisporosarcina indica]|uniref:VanZ family protein n=1 Tax=Paenisporosarcina indica TaxID=650093 RepID=UPI00094F881D|nr:VanZ family protein [Paenisporosarcina indica]
MVVYPLFTFLWAVFIFVATCTSDAHAFLYDQEIQFTFEFAPNFMDLLITSDVHLMNEFYLIQKTGHVFTFGILYILHLLWVRNFGKAFALTGIFAAFSEVLQLYFNRNGRLFDVGVDFVGIFVAYLFCKSFIVNLISARHSHS